MIFGTLRQCFVLNTSFNSILNKFITLVVPPSDKINNSVFRLQYQARLLHSNAHVFKIIAPICTIFGTIEHRDVLNMSVTYFHQLLNTKRCHMAKDKTPYSVIINSSKVTLLNLSCFLALSKCYKIFFKNRLHERHCII